MDEYLQWLFAGLGFCLLAGWLGYRALKRAEANRQSKRAVVEAAARAEAHRLATEEAARQQAAWQAAAQRAARAAEATRLAEEEAARAEAARLTAEKLALAEAERASAARAAAAARAEAARLVAEEAARAQAARLTAEKLALAEAERASAARAAAAARAEAARLVAEEAARAQAARRAAEQAARAAAEEAARLEAERRAALEASAKAVPAPIVAVKTPAQTLVMVADDSKLVRVKTGRLLAQHQYEVLYATDGTDAAQQMQTRIPDIVITDVEMPGMDGFELTRHVRQNPLTAHIPVIMITAADDKHREDAQRAGVSVLLGKPYPEEDLIAHIRSAMNHDPMRAGALV